MEILQNKKKINSFFFLFTVTYMVSYITRINFGAIVSEMESATNISRSLLSMSLTGSFITYGIGQLISGVLGDRFSPKKLVSAGFIATVLMNLLLPLCKNPFSMLFVWCINGFAQSFMWPPMVRLMSAFLSDEDYQKCTARVMWGGSFGTIAVYLISPLIISLFSWKGVFVFSAICGIITLLMWNRFSPDIPPEKKQVSQASSSSSKGILFAPFMICIFIAIIMQGMVKDGITTWMPSYISDTYNLSNVISILSGVVFPIFSIIALQVASKIYGKFFANPVSCAGTLFVTGAVSAFALYLFSGKSAFMSVLFSAVLIGCIHGVNFMLIGIVPRFFSVFGNISTVSGVINACTYLGSAISTYAIALLSENAGWSLTLFTWIFIALFGTLFCFVAAKPWYKKMQTDCSD